MIPHAPPSLISSWVLVNALTGQVGPSTQVTGYPTDLELDAATGQKLFSRFAVTPFKASVCLRSGPVLGRLRKLAAIGVTFAFQFGEKALVTLLAL
jgi:hypothetical protein